MDKWDVDTKTRCVTGEDPNVVNCTDEDGKLKLQINVREFSPKDISVKTIDDHLVVEGLVEKKEGNSISKQQFVRKIQLPPGIDVSGISSTLTRDGTLTVTAPKLPGANTGNTRTVVKTVRTSNVATAEEPQAITCVIEDGKYKFSLDVKDLNKKNINVKTVDDTLVVESEVEKKEGNAISKQKFQRRITLPPGIDVTKISSTLTSEGILNVTAPKLAEETFGLERNVPVGFEIRPMNDSSSFASSNTQSESSRQQQQPGRVTETIIIDVPENRGTTIFSTTAPAASRPLVQPAAGTITVPVNDDWSSFSEIATKAQKDMEKEMEDMMRRHSMEPTKESALVHRPMQPTSTVVPVIKERFVDGNTVREREEKNWEEAPAPGIRSKHHTKTESSVTNGDNGYSTSKTTVQKSQTVSGDNDANFARTYQTKHESSFSSNNAKAV